MVQTKQEKTAKIQLSEVETGNIPEKDFRVMIIKMIQELGRRMDAQSKKSEVFKRVRKYKQKPDLKNIITEMEC